MTFLIGFLIILPLFDTSSNPIFIILTYVFRVKIIFSNKHFIVDVVIMLFGIIMFFIFSFAIKFISSFIVRLRDKKRKTIKAYEQLLIKSISE